MDLKYIIDMLLMCNLAGVLWLAVTEVEPMDKTFNISRRQLLAAAAGSSLAALGSAGDAEVDSQSDPCAAPDASVEAQTAIRCFPIRHGGVSPLRHPRLGVEVAGQSALSTLRFFRTVRLNRVEIPPTVYGRDQPVVPCHPAHVQVSVFHRENQAWEIVRDLTLPANPKFSGAGLSPKASPAAMQAFFEKAIAEHKPWRIDLDGLLTDHIRLECDREHPTWPNARECNGGLHNVPFGIFHEVAVHGEALGDTIVAPYRPILRRRSIRPSAPSGMRLERKADVVFYRSPQLSVGFSLNRPLLMHLGWDAAATGRADVNRLLVTRTWWIFGRKPELFGGLTGPLIRTLDGDFASYLWTGDIEIEGNEVRYRELTCGAGLTLDVTFRVMADRLELTIEQTCERQLTALEYEAWRFAWDVRPSPTGIGAIPTEMPGRNGHVHFPVLITGEGSGCLLFTRAASGDDRSAAPYLQAESYREAEALTCGIVPGQRTSDGFGVLILQGRQRLEFELVVTNLQPSVSAARPSAPLSEGIRRHWATVFSCYRPEYRGFSNNCVSVNCHQGQWSQTEVLTHTEQPKNAPDLAGMHRFTVEKALLDGGGYGYWREYFMDSDPSLLCAAGSAYRLNASREWLERIKPGLIDVFERMVAMAGKDGLLVNPDRSGNSGDNSLSTNGIDVIRFGYLDAFSNAWAYRGLRNVAPIFASLGDRARAARALEIAGRMRKAYGPVFINPASGWVAGWRSKDGVLHDYAYLGINGLAAAFGLLDYDAAHTALGRLEGLRARACPVSDQLGLPGNLLPHRKEDQYFGELLGNSTPTFELFCDGGLSAILVGYYVRALSSYGFREKARHLADELDQGYADNVFSGGVGSGNEMRSWEGLPSGYEGTLTYNHGLLYAIAVEKNIIEPMTPEWWPAMPS